MQWTIQVTPLQLTPLQRCWGEISLMEQRYSGCFAHGCVCWTVSEVGDTCSRWQWQQLHCPLRTPAQHRCCLWHMPREWLCHVRPSCIPSVSTSPHTTPLPENERRKFVIIETLTEVCVFLPKVKTFTAGWIFAGTATNGTQKSGVTGSKKLINLRSVLVTLVFLQCFMSSSLVGLFWQKLVS